MTELWVLIGLIIGAAAVSIQGAAFSVFGLGELFSGATLAITLIASALEFSKFVLAAYLHQGWSRLGWALKIYLTIAVIVLSAITSMGIFGYLSSAYQQSSSTLEQEQIKIAGLRAEKDRTRAEIERINKAIDEIPVTRVSKKLEARTEAEPLLSKLTADDNRLAHEITQAELQILEVKKHVGPLIYIASAFKVDIDSIVKYLILILVSVIDPLAICMVIAVSESLNSRKLMKLGLLDQMQKTPPIVANVSVVSSSLAQGDDVAAAGAAAATSKADLAAAVDAPVETPVDVNSPQSTVITMRFADQEANPTAPEVQKRVV